MSKNHFPKIVWEKLCIDSIIENYGLETKIKQNIFVTIKNILKKKKNIGTFSVDNIATNVNGNPAISGIKI